MLITFTLIANGQWYYNSFGVMNLNELSQDQLNFALSKAEKTVSTGQFFTLIGSMTAIIGISIYAQGISNMSNARTSNLITTNLNRSYLGAGVMAVGGTIASIGIPIWIVGANKRNDIQIALVKFNGQASINGFGLNVKF